MIGPARRALVTALLALAALFLAPAAASAAPSDRPCDRSSSVALERSKALSARCAPVTYAVLGTFLAQHDGSESLVLRCDDPTHVLSAVTYTTDRPLDPRIIVTPLPVGATGDVVVGFDVDSTGIFAGDYLVTVTGTCTVPR